MKRSVCKTCLAVAAYRSTVKISSWQKTEGGKKSQFWLIDLWLILLIWRSEGRKSNRVALQELVEIQYPRHELSACHDLVSRVTVWITGAWTLASLCTLLQRYMSGSLHFNAYKDHGQNGTFYVCVLVLDQPCSNMADNRSYMSYIC